MKLTAYKLSLQGAFVASFKMPVSIIIYRSLKADHLWRVENNFQQNKKSLNLVNFALNHMDCSTRSQTGYVYVTSV